MSWSFGGQVAQRACSFLAALAIARLLGTSGFGQLGMVQTTVGMFGIVAGFGLGSTATKYVAQYHKTDPHRAGHVVTITLLTATTTSGLLAILVFIFSPWIAAHMLASAALTGAVKVSALLFFVLTLDGVAVATLRGLQAFRELAMVGAVRGAVTIVSAIPFAYVWGVPGAVAAMCTSASVGLVLTLYAGYRQCQGAQIPLTFALPPLNEWQVLWQYSLPAMLAGMLVVPPAWIGQALLVRQPAGFAELGFYTVGCQWLALSMFLPSIFGTVLMPLVASSEGSKADRLQLFVAPLATTALAVAAMVLACIVLAGPILSLYGPDFAHAKAVFVVMMITTFVAALNEILFQSLMGMGAPYLRLLASAVRAVVFIVCIFLLVPHFLALGLAVARLVAAMVYVCVQLPIYCYQAQRFAPAMKTPTSLLAQ